MPIRKSEKWIRGLIWSGTPNAHKTRVRQQATAAIAMVFLQPAFCNAAASGNDRYKTISQESDQAGVFQLTGRNRQVATTSEFVQRGKALMACSCTPTRLRFLLQVLSFVG